MLVEMPPCPAKAISGAIALANRPLRFLPHIRVLLERLIEKGDPTWDSKKAPHFCRFRFAEIRFTKSPQLLKSLACDSGLIDAVTTVNRATASFRACSTLGILDCLYHSLLLRPSSSSGHSSFWRGDAESAATIVRARANPRSYSALVRGKGASGVNIGAQKSRSFTWPRKLASARSSPSRLLGRVCCHRLYCSISLSANGIYLNLAPRTRAGSGTSNREQKVSTMTLSMRPLSNRASCPRASLGCTNT